MALGARTRNVRNLVFREGMTPVGVGFTDVDGNAWMSDPGSARRACRSRRFTET